MKQSNTGKSMVSTEAGEENVLISFEFNRSTSRTSEFNSYKEITGCVILPLVRAKQIGHSFVISSRFLEVSIIVLSVILHAIFCLRAFVRFCASFVVLSIYYSRVLASTSTLRSSSDLICSWVGPLRKRPH